VKQIPVFKPLVGGDEVEAASRSLIGGWHGMGASVGEFENELESFLQLQDRSVVALSTGHAALHLAMLLCEIGDGDEVITPSFNNVADLQAIMAVGARPVFCDIDEETLCIDLSKAQELVGPKTRAIIAMDYGCQLVDHEHLGSFASSNKLRVIHDAAHSFGSRYKGKMVGSFSDICMFSFDPVKTITCIDGGALVVKTKEDVAALQEMRLIGMNQPASIMYGNNRAWTYGVSRIGYRYHLANLHAEIGRCQLGKISRIESSRRSSSALYNQILQDVKEVVLPKQSFEEIVPFIYYIRVPSQSRSRFREFLREHGVDTGIHWQPGHTFELFRNSRCGNLEVTNRISQEIVTLPLHSEMLEEDVYTVSRAIKSFFRSYV
jgi:dTDP-4-amino-4,6-dideoxygalactose transaminase